MAGRRCSAVRPDGRECRAWAVRGSEPPLCSAHAGLNVGAGPPEGNVNSLKHGVYSGRITMRELADLAWHAEVDTVLDEIALTRVSLARLAEYIGREDVTPLDVAKVMEKLVAAVRAVGNLVRTERVLSGEAGDGIAAALAQALDEIGVELGVDL